MAKPVVELSSVVAVKAQFVKFLPTEKSPQGNAILELRCLDKDGYRCGTVQCGIAQTKKALADAPRDAVIVEEKRTRIPIQGTWAVRGLKCQQGEVVTNQFLVGDFELLGPSSVVEISVSNAVEPGFDPFKA